MYTNICNALQSHNDFQNSFNTIVCSLLRHSNVSSEVQMDEIAVASVPLPMLNEWIREVYALMKT